MLFFSDRNTLCHLKEKIQKKSIPTNVPCEKSFQKKCQSISLALNLQLNTCKSDIFKLTFLFQSIRNISWMCQKIIHLNYYISHISHQQLLFCTRKHVFIHCKKGSCALWRTLNTFMLAVSDFTCIIHTRPPAKGLNGCTSV